MPRPPPCRSPRPGLPCFCRKCCREEGRSSWVISLDTSFRAATSPLVKGMRGAHRPVGPGRSGEGGGDGLWKERLPATASAAVTRHPRNILKERRKTPSRAKRALAARAPSFPPRFFFNRRFLPATVPLAHTAGKAHLPPYLPSITQPVLPTPYTVGPSSGRTSGTGREHPCRRTSWARSA